MYLQHLVDVFFSHKNPQKLCVILIEDFIFSKMQKVIENSDVWP